MNQDTLSYEARARAVLSGQEFHFSKRLGQNFILSDDVMAQIAEASGARPGDKALEIGAGAGSLTSALLRRGVRVLAMEVDDRLQPVLEALIGDTPDAELRFGDIQKCDPALLKADMDARWDEGRDLVIANLPYYITTDVLTMFAKSSAAFDSLCFMVQREAAQRITAQLGDEQYCLLSALMYYKYDIESVMELPRTLFTPPPHVDSTLLRFTPLETPRAAPHDEPTFMRTLSAAFLMRRKTMVNNLCAAFGLNRATALSAMESAGPRPDMRGEAMTLEELARLSDAVYDLIHEQLDTAKE